MIPFENDWRAGVIPAMLDEDDPRGAVEQLNEQRPWSPFKGFEMSAGYKLTYPDDPPMSPVAAGVLHDKEMILVYPFDWVAVVQEDGSFVVARLD